MRTIDSVALCIMLVFFAIIIGNPALAFQNPHAPAGPGPWFEGWYTRISDQDGSRSLAVIVGSHLPEGEEYQPGECLPGYIQILFSEGDGFPVQTYEAFPECTYALIDGKPVDRTQTRNAQSDFEWTGIGYGTITEDTIDLAIPGAARVWARFFQRLSWGSIFGGIGPEGLLGLMPLPMHWYVYSLGSVAEYEYETLTGDHIGVLIEGMGYAHQEKNWGTAFPRAWMWLEGIRPENQSHIVSGGGILSIGPMSFRPWILGYHSPSLSWDFNFAKLGTIFEKEIDACKGYFHLIARTPTRTLDITATGPKGSFASIGIPSTEGFVSNGAIESFSATIEVKAYRHGPLTGLFGPGRLVEKQVFTNAVLEFGAEYQNCSQSE